MAELRPKIVKLAKMVGGIAGAMNKIDEDAPEYYSLNAVVTDEMADVALSIGLRQPRTLEYIVEKCGKSKEETQALLTKLAETGVCKVWTDKEDGKNRYFVNIFAPGMLEMMVNNREQLAAHPELGKSFEEYTRRRLAPMAALFPEGLAMLWPDMLWFWIIAYDLWNFAYTYNCLPTHAWYCGFALLLAPTICAFTLGKGAWLQHRAQTLALWCM